MGQHNWKTQHYFSGMVILRREALHWSNSTSQWLTWCCMSRSRLYRLHLYRSNWCLADAWQPFSYFINRSKWFSCRFLQGYSLVFYQCQVLSESIHSLASQVGGLKYLYHLFVSLSILYSILLVGHYCRDSWLFTFFDLSRPSLWHLLPSCL